MEINYDEVFGDNAEQTAPEAAQAAPEAAPAQEASQDAQQAESQQEGAENARQGEKPRQSAEENARQAAGRRIREREAAAEARGKAAMQAEVDAVLRRLGMPNPDTGEAVDSWTKLEEYERGLSSARIASGRPTEEDIRRVAREEMSGQSQAQEQRAPTEADYAAEVAEISRMDPSINNLGDILRSEAGPKFREYVAKGLNFVDAYTLAARDRLAQRQTEAARVKAAGKDHLSATQSVHAGEGDLPVPADELELFRAMMPDTPDAEFRKYWNKNRRK